MSINGQSLHHKMIAHAIIILLFKNAGKKDAGISYPKSYLFLLVFNCLYPLSSLIFIILCAFPWNFLKKE